MSRVTSLVVTCSLLDEAAISSLNDWMSENSRGVQFMPVNPISAGGGKALQINIYACAVNYFDPDEELALEFQRISWELPHEATLLIHPEDGPTRIVPAFDFSAEARQARLARLTEEWSDDENWGSSRVRF